MNSVERIIIFGKGRMIEQWRVMAKAQSHIVFCDNYAALKYYPVQNSAIVYFVTDINMGMKIAIKFRLLGYQKIIKRWTGTDVLQYGQLPWHKQRIATLIFNVCVASHLTSADWLSKKLSDIGLKNPLWWPAPSPLFYQAKSLSQSLLNEKWQNTQPKNIILYSNDQREWLYQTDLMLKVIDELPDYQFFIIGHPNLNLKPLKNIKNLGIVDEQTMHELYVKSHILIRITAHDGFARMIMESLQYGLHVIGNYPREHTHIAHQLDDIVKAVKEIDTANLAGRQYALKHFTPKNWLQILNAQI